MTALWIILAVALVLTVLNLLPVGVDAAYADDVFSLAARIGPFRLRLLPKPPDAKPKKKKPPKPKKEKPKKNSAPPDIRTILALAKLGLQALNRFRQRLRVQLLRLVFVSGAPDPYDTALACGYVNAALGALTPLAARALRIDELDLDATKVLVIGSVIDAENIHALRNKGKAAGHRDSCHNKVLLLFLFGTIAKYDFHKFKGLLFRESAVHKALVYCKSLYGELREL